ncbi:MAG: serine hydroxymethyltransferase, partial [Clostridiales bacterium]|nr:serine hydroxymethyltransferase [Clostridiales bacterium]
VCFEEAQKPEFKAYQQRIIDNAKALERSLKAEGVRLVSGGTDNHLLLLDLGSDGLTGKEVEQLLDRANITVNKNSVPNETRKPTVTSGIRVGTPAATTRGLNEDDFVLVGRLIADIIKNGEEAVERVAAKVREITDKYPLYPGE